MKTRIGISFLGILLVCGLAAPPLLGQQSSSPKTTLSAVAAASTAGTSINTQGYACVAVQAWAASGTASSSVYIQQSLDNTHWKNVWTFTNPSATAGAAEIITLPGAPYTRGYVASDYASGSISATVGWGAFCNATAGAKAQASLPSATAEVSDGAMFIPAWAACGVTTPSATFVVTRAAAGDWNLTRTAAGAETYSVACSLGSFLKRTTTGTGIKITSVKIVHQITVAALTSNAAPTLKQIVYANNTASAITNFGGTLTVTMPTAAQANPYVTSVGIGTPAYFNAADADLVLDLSAIVMQNTGVLAIQGIIVGFSRT